MAIRGGNYGRVGRALGDSSLEINAINMESSPDYGGLAEKSIQNRSKERQAVTAAEAVVEQTGIREKAKVKGYGVLADSKKKIADIEAPAKRMAGLVPAVGALASGAVLKRGMDLDAADAIERKAEHKERLAEYKKIFERSQSTKPEPLPAPPMMEQPDLLPIPKPGDTPSSSPTSSTSQNVSTSVGDIDPQEMYTYVRTKHGLSHNNALGYMSNVMRESSFQTNPQGGDGGHSFGTLQWNDGAGRSTRMMKHVPDWQTNWRGQVDFSLSQNQEAGYNQFATHFKTHNYATPSLAGAAWTRNFEKPAHPERDIQTQDRWLSTANFSLPLQQAPNDWPNP